MQNTEISPPSQGRFRLGRAVLKVAGVVVPVEVQATSGWQIAGAVRVAAADVGFHQVPTSMGGRRVLIRRDVKQVRRELGRAA